ncbi:MAG: PAS domain S-box protein [Methanoregula sp.]|nr:PAS domain S-box protein [Methanoregula sp.]
MVSDPDGIRYKKPDGTSTLAQEHLLLKRLTIVFGLLAAGTSIIGLLAARFTIVLVGGEIPGNKTIALSAALIWIILGSVLTYHTVKPFGRIAGRGMQVSLVLIAVAAGTEFIFSIFGGHSPLEKFFISAGMTIMGPSSSPISPMAAILAVVAALSLAAIIRSAGIPEKTTRMRDVVSIPGFLISLVSITFVLSYAYGNPLLYGTDVIPVAFMSALAAFFTGASLIAAAGPGAFPVTYFVGDSTSARLLRVFVPLVAVIILSENLIFVGLSSWFSIQDAVLLSSIVVVFVFATALVVARVSGGIGRALEIAEDELARKNEDLGNLNEELTASEEELRQNIDELTRSEEEVKNTLQRFFLVLGEMQYGVLLVSHENRIEFANRAFCDIFGLKESPASLTGISATEMVEKIRFSYTNPDEAVVRIGEIVREGVQVIGEDVGMSGGRTFLRDFVPLNPGGKFFGRLWVHRDITESKRFEEQLRYHANLVETVSDAIISTDTDLRIQSWNKAAETMYGWKAEEVVGKKGSNTLKTEFPEGMSRETLTKNLFENGAWHGELIQRTKDGQKIIVEATSIGLRDNAGHVIGGVSVGRNITDRKKGEEALKRKNLDLIALNEEIIASQEELQHSNEDLIRSEEELRKTSQYLENLIDYANAPIVVWDPHFVITRFNHAFEELTGRTAREIIGQRLEVLFPRQYLDHSMEIIRKTMNGERLRVVEIPILNRTGEIRIVLWNSATLFEPDGKTIQSTIAQGDDITDRKAAEAELEKRNAELNSAIEELSRQGDELSEALKEKEILLSEIHHRVKNNLTAFISLLSLKGSYEETPSGNALKKDLQNRARSMALIHETLYRTGKYSQVDMKEYLSPLVRQIALSYDPSSLMKTEVKVNGATLDLSRATPCGLIVTELITNSFKYAFPPSFDCMKIRSEPCTIRVSLEHDGEDYCLSVSDNGTGLPQGFDIRTAQSLGLRLVYFLARHQLKARIEVKTECGTEITFRFS